MEETKRYPIDIEVQGIDTRDYPDFCDAYISSAVWSDTLEELTEDELEELNQDGQLVYECVIEKLY